MIVDEQPIRFTWGPIINLVEFPHLLLTFQQRVPSRPNKPTTAEIERRASDLVKSNFANKDDLRDFIRTVCNWGGYPGIAGRILKGSRIERIAATFQKAYRQAQGGNVVEALKTLQQTKSLRGVSFASKHLKFLAPEKAVVLDSILSGRLGYRMDVDGYARFLNDCNTILHHILAEEVKYTGWATSGWRVSDVEMAIFAKVKFGLKPPSPFRAA